MMKHGSASRRERVHAAKEWRCRERSKSPADRRRCDAGRAPYIAVRAVPPLPPPPPTPPTPSTPPQPTVAIESRTIVARVSIPRPITVAVPIDGSIGGVPVPVTIAAPVACRCRFGVKYQKRRRHQYCQKYQSTHCALSSSRVPACTRMSPGQEAGTTGEPRISNNKVCKRR